MTAPANYCWIRLARLPEHPRICAVSSLWESMAPGGAAIGGAFHGPGRSVVLSQLAGGSIFGAALESLRGRSVLLATHDQLPTALALIELDGVARRMVLCTPDLKPEQLAAVAATAQADAIVLDEASTADAGSLTRYVVTS